MMKFYAIAALTVGTLFLSSCSLFERQAEHWQSVSTESPNTCPFVTNLARFLEVALQATEIRFS